LVGQAVVPSEQGIENRMEVALERNATHLGESNRDVIAMSAQEVPLSVHQNRRMRRHTIQVGLSAQPVLPQVLEVSEADLTYVGNDNQSASDIASGVHAKRDNDANLE
jgi:hypothetical protein